MTCNVYFKSRGRLSLGRSGWQRPYPVNTYNAWATVALMASVRDALDRPWVLDMDATIKRTCSRDTTAAIRHLRATVVTTT